MRYEEKPEALDRLADLVKTCQVRQRAGRLLGDVSACLYLPLVPAACKQQALVCSCLQAAAACKQQLLALGVRMQGTADVSSPLTTAGARARDAAAAA